MSEYIDCVAQLRLQWFAGLRDEDKLKVTADIIEFKNEDKRKERFAERTEIFNNSDLDQNGFIDRSEFDDFTEKIGQSTGARGVPYMFADEVSNEMKQRTFDLYNSYNEQNDGITLEDYNAVTLMIYDKMRELASQ